MSKEWEYVKVGTRGSTGIYTQKGPAEPNLFSSGFYLI